MIWVYQSNVRGSAPTANGFIIAYTRVSVEIATITGRKKASVSCRIFPKGGVNTYPRRGALECRGFWCLTAFDFFGLTRIPSAMSPARPVSSPMRNVWMAHARSKLVTCLVPALRYSRSFWQATSGRCSSPNLFAP